MSEPCNKKAANAPETLGDHATGASLPRLTASRLDLARACPGSFALPHIPTAPGAAARKGTLIHAYIEHVLGGVADPPLPEEKAARRVCESLDAGALCEVAVGSGVELLSIEQPLGWDPGTGRAAAPEVDEHAEHRDYSAFPDAFVAGTADVISVFGDHVRVTDFKTGSYEVADPGENPQLLFLGLAAAKAHGKDRAVVQVASISDDGALKVRRAELRPRDLERVEDDLGNILRAVEESRAAGPPKLRPGRHCRFCPALPNCPAIAREAQALIEEPLDELDAESVAGAWGRLQAVEAAAKRTRDALTLYVANRGEEIPLDGGATLKLVEGRRQNLDPGVALKIVAERFGAEAAYAAASVSPTSLKKVVKDREEARRILASIEEAGGLANTTYESLRESPPSRPSAPSP